MDVKPRLLVLSRYSRLGASSRLRTHQYRRFLEGSNFEVEFNELFDDAYLTRLYKGEKGYTALPSYYLRRFLRLRKRPAPTIIWLEYEALPWIPWLVERALLPNKVPVVVDYDDAVFHRYDRHARAQVRQILGSKIDQVMKRSALVTAGNDYIADRALTAGAQNVELVPTVIDLAHYEVSRASGSSSSPQIGWIGTPSTWAEYMAPVMGMIAALASKHGGRVLAVGAGVNAGEFGPTLQTVPWTEDTEVTRIQQMDIGIMPLTDTPWARGKCGYKLIQYMACGLPVVASPVGVNANIVEHGHNGFLASTEAEWVEAIEALLVDGDLRRRMGANGRRKVEEMYSLQAWGPRVADMMESLARRNMSS